MGGYAASQSVNASCAARYGYGDERAADGWLISEFVSQFNRR